ncbi:MAG: C4-dicarboxylate ABC transporter permease [Gammaproteobacteria bacterium]|nr:MAG: C4-dicarboxylate ABC transporter permease [Gammaproteobacteria bacterium]
MKRKDNKVLITIDAFEDGLLVLILSTMILLAVYQIISRNLFSQGVVWIDPLLRTLVLWVGLAGAVVATRTDNHIRIDIFTKYFPEKFLPHIARTVHFFTLSVCLLIAWHASRFVYSEYVYGTIAFSGVPAWLTAIIIPLSFLLIAIRYGVLLFSPQVIKSNTSVTRTSKKQP